MPKRTAHDLEEKWRSDDIRSGEDVDFSSLLLPDEILQGLTAAGFKYPSPIQLKAIPATRIGKDVIIQAKSGTGKTLVFAVAALNMLMKGSKHPQVLIMAPTREIACQISQVINAISAAHKDIKCQYFIGGFNQEDDVGRIEGCQIIVGTPGRIRYLITAKILRTSGIRLFVFDEADQLLREKSFEKDINDIFRSLPRDKQIIATSATYHRLKKLIDKYFREPIIIRLNQQNVALLGMVHYYREIPVINLPVLAYKLKLGALKDVLHNVKFAQCLVFCNMVSRVENLCVDIKKLGFATSFISSAREQEDRLKAIEMLRRFKCKVLVASDVSSRGIDAENVDLVINFDLPPHLDIYFHRVGRAGRYGARCANVSFVTSSEIDLYLQMQEDGNFSSFTLPYPVPSDLISRGQPETSDDESNSPTSDSDSGAEDVNENGEAQPEKTNDFDCIQLNGDEVESKSNSDLDSGAENLNENEKAQLKKTKVFNLNSNPTNTSCALSNTSQFVGQELYKSDPPVFHKIKPGKKITEVIVALEEENNKLKVNGSSIEELCVNDELVGEKLDQQSCAASVIENTKNGLSPHIHELKQSTDTNSYLAHLESGSEKSLEEKTNNDNLLVMNNKGSTSKSFSNPVSKELIRSVITFIEKYEKQNKDFADCSSSNFTKSSQTIEVELVDNKFSPASLVSLRSNLGRYYYNIYKEFIVNIPEVWIEEIAPEYTEVKKDNQVLEIGSQNDVKQIHGENKIPDFNLNLQHTLFSTPKRGAPLGSDEESSNCDVNELTEQFNLYLKNMRSKEAKRMSSAADIRINRKLMTMLENESIRQLGCNNETVDKSNEKGIINDARSDSDASIEILYDSRQHRIKVNIIDVKSDSELDASVQYLYASKQRIEVDMEGYDYKCKLNSQSDSDTMDVLNEAYNRDSAEDESFNKFVNTVLAYKKGKQTDAGPSKDAKNLSKLPPEIQSNDRRIKHITKVDTRKHAESPSSTSSDSRKGTVKPQKGVDRVMQNEKNKVSNAKKSPNYTICKTKTVKGSAKNKITYYYSQNENDVDQLPTEAQFNLEDGHKRKTRGNDERVSKTDGGCETELMNRPGQKKIAINNSESSSSEAEVSCDQYSKVCDFNPQGRRHNRKRTPKKDKTLPETGPFGFGYSKDTSNPSCSRPCSRQSQNHGNQTAYHSNRQMQLPYDASSLCNDQYSHQSPIMNERVHHSRYKKQSSTNDPNPYCQKYPQKEPDHKCSADFSTNNFNRPKNLCPLICNAPSIREVQPSHDNFNPCFLESRHPCHPPNESCQSVLCATWYDIFYKQWQFRNPNGY